jgi:hypothetical protein
MQPGTRMGRMSIYVTDSSEANWILWVDQNGQRPGLDQLFAGRVKLQDDPIATATASSKRPSSNLRRR